MSTGTRYPHDAAIAEVRTLRGLCEDAAEAWAVAGSLRRGRLDVGDVEHVLIPRTVTPPPEPSPVDLFGNPIGSAKPAPTLNLLLERLDALVASGEIAKAIKSDGKPRWGERYRALTLRGSDLHHELWMGDTLNYGALLAIRTGPQELSVSLVSRFRDRGMRQVEGYLRRISRTPHPDGTATETVGEIVPVPDEDTYFRLAGWKQTPAPADRDNHAEFLRRSHR